jgi:hypothetical protein
LTNAAGSSFFFAVRSCWLCIYLGLTLFLVLLCTSHSCLPEQVLFTFDDVHCCHVI